MHVYIGDTVAALLPQLQGSIPVVHCFFLGAAERGGRRRNEGKEDGGRALVHRDVGAPLADANGLTAA